jgi:high-affinity iron transporter
MIGSFLIFLREGIEGTLIAAIILTYLNAGGRRDLFRWVLGGALVAVVASAGVGGALYGARAEFVGSDAQKWFETATFGLAVAVLTYMTFWMKRHARMFGSELKAGVDSALRGDAGSGLALAILALVTVGREALETAIFVVAIAFQSSAGSLAIGATAGLGVALALSFGIYKMGMRLNLGRFFTIVGAALMVVAAGLLMNMIQNLQELGVIGQLPMLGQRLWNTGSLIPQDSTLGDILHGLVGYAASPTALQVLAYILFLAIGLTFFLRRSGTKPSPQPSSASR